MYEVNGKKVRGRIYPWGVVDSKLELIYVSKFLMKNVSAHSSQYKILKKYIIFETDIHVKSLSSKYFIFE